MNKTILLTGDSKGLGLETRKHLEAIGYNVLGISRNSIDIKYDLSNTKEIKQLYLDQIKPVGPIHAYINNAAFAYDDIVTNLNLEQLSLMYNINVFSPMLLTKYVIRDMLLHNTQGNIVHISSISAHTGYKGLAMYASSKGAIEAFSKNTAREWGRMGIRSNVVAPGFMETDMSKGLSDQQKHKIFTRNSMMKKLKIDEVVKTIGFLVGEDSHGLTGQVINVDNGSI